MSRLDATGAAVMQGLLRTMVGAPMSRLDATGSAAKHERHQTMGCAR